jgi:hypothetical protein
MPKSRRVRIDDDGQTYLRGPDGTDVRLAGFARMHFYRLTGATPEDASDEQVERYFTLKAQEEETGQRTTKVIKNESAADMVTRELKIVNFQQVVSSNEFPDLSEDAPPPRRQTQPRTPLMNATPPSVSSSPPQSALPPQSGNSGELSPPPRYRAGGEGLPPAPRYQPREETPVASPVDGSPPAGPASEEAPVSRFVRREGNILFLQAPDGSEQRVTQYMRVHFQRMIEKEITQASDEEVEMWWKLQGSLETGTSLPEAQSQNLLTEALKAAGKLKREELDVLHQAVSSWLQARRDEDGGVS